MIKVGIGQDSHRFEEEGSDKPLVLGGITIPGCPGLAGNSDADVVMHAITNAVSSITCVNILGKISDDLCLKQGIRDSRVYLEEALKYMKNGQIHHLAISVEGLRPKLSEHIPHIRAHLATLLNISTTSVGFTATTGEGLTAFGRGEGIFCTVLLTVDMP